MESNSRTRAAREREYDDFEPTFEWAQEAAADTLLIYLPGFRKEQLKVQVTSTRNLRIFGERQVSGNKWSRFREEIPISTNYDPNEISAKFEKGILFVKLPKIIVPATPQQGKELSPRKPTEEKAQPPAQVPKLDQKAPQEKAGSSAEAAKAKTTPALERVQPPAVASKSEKPSQEEDKTLGGGAKPGKPKREPESQGPDPKIGTDKQKNADKDGAASANAAPKKATMKDKEERKYEGKEQTNRRPEAGKVNTAASTSVEHETTDDSVHNKAKLDKDKTATGIVYGSGRFEAGKYRQVLNGLAMELKKPRKLIYLFLAILSVVVFALNAMDAIRSLRRSEN